MGWRLPLEFVCPEAQLFGSYATDDFLTACREGDITKLRALTSSGTGSPFVQAPDGVTPLCLAIQHGHVDVVKFLLEGGVPVDVLFGKNNTCAFAWALRQGNPDVCRAVVAYNPSFCHLDLRNWSPIFYLWPGGRCTQNRVSSSRYSPRLRRC